MSGLPATRRFPTLPAAMAAHRHANCLTLRPLRRISAHPGEVRISPGLYFMTLLRSALFEAG
jgi:hypothetical protein